MSDYKLVVFDVDGTLLDTTEGLIAAVKYVIEKYSLEQLTEEQLLTFIGPPIQNSFRKYYRLPDSKIQELADSFRDRYKSSELYKAVPYEGIYDVMQILKELGKQIAIATYKRQDYAIDILKYFHFDKYSEIMYGADNYNELTKRDIILKCIEDSGIQSFDEVVMVGDSDNDAIGAKELGIDFIGVTYGFGFKSARDVQQMWSIGYANNPKQIISFLK